MTIKLGSQTLDSVEILMVDDDDLDFETFQRTLNKLKIANELYHCIDGVSALEFMRNRLNSNPTKTLVVLMDINMPRMNGIECIQAIRADPELKRTIIFVMTTSESDKDMLAAYDLNVAGYLVKSDLGNGFVDGVMLLDNYWRVVELPPQPN